MEILMAESSGWSNISLILSTKTFNRVRVAEDTGKLSLKCKAKSLTVLRQKPLSRILGVCTELSLNISRDSTLFLYLPQISLIA